MMEFSSILITRTGSQRSSFNLLQAWHSQRQHHCHTVNDELRGQEQVHWPNVKMQLLSSTAQTQLLLLAHMLLAHMPIPYQH